MVKIRRCARIKRSSTWSKRLIGDPNGISWTVLSPSRDCPSLRDTLQVQSQSACRRVTSKGQRVLTCAGCSRKGNAKDCFDDGALAAGLIANDGHFRNFDFSVGTGERGASGRHGEAMSDTDAFVCSHPRSSHSPAGSKLMHQSQKVLSLGRELRRVEA